jgi:Uma2 family endonuclease
LTDLGEILILGVMAEPVWKTPPGESHEPAVELEDDEPVFLERWIERPDGTLELLSRPLTPEDFLDPQFGDKWVQGPPHQRACHDLFDLLDRHLRSEEGVLVLSDTKLLPGRPGLGKPAPDVFVVRGARNPDIREMSSFNVVKQGAVPCFVLEVLSPSKRIRHTDKEDKKALYERLGIPEYLLVDPPRKKKKTRHRFEVKGYRLGADGRYREIEPDAEGRILSETTGLLFGVSPAGDRLEIFDARTGERLLTSREEEEGRKAAEAKAAAERRARKAAEAKAAAERGAREAAETELTRLRAEIERLKTAGR